MNIEKLWSLLEREALHFSRVTSFADPFEGRLPEYNKKMGRHVYSNAKNSFQNEQQFENFLRVRIQGFENSYNSMKNTTLVNCWHLNENESASMWKLYATNNDGIAIQSTYQRLSDSFKNNTTDTVLIGTVTYTDFSKQWMPEWNAYEPFVFKRISFESEAELRAITSLPDPFGKRILSEADKKREKTKTQNPRVIDPKEITKNGKFVKTELENLVEKIYIAPLASDEFQDMVKSMVMKISPNLENRIEKSELYTLN